jgi:RNA polymerase sigma-70 factor (ECF subfamily)
MTSSDPAPSVPPESLLEHRDWVRRLACCLAGRVADPDDLEQDVWLAAMRSPPTHDTGLRGWFRRVMGNRVRELHRQSERRERRERAAAVPDEVRPTGDAVAEIEAHGRLVQAVLSLEEPYRTTLVLRFFRELPPREVAARMGVPVETARTRVKRGLKLLRLELDESGGMARVLVPLLGLPDQVWPHIGSAATSGGIAMAVTGKQVASVAALVLCGVGMAVGVDLWQRSGPSLAAPADVLQTAEVEGLQAPDIERPRKPRHTAEPEIRELVDGGTEETPPPAGGGGSGTVVGRVFGPDGAAVEGLALTASGNPRMEFVRTDAEGRFRIEEVSAGQAVSLIVATAAYRCNLEATPLVRADEVTDEVIVRLEPYRRVRVRGTVDAAGQPVADARVRATGFESPSPGGDAVSRAFSAVFWSRKMAARGAGLADEISAEMNAALSTVTDSAGRFELDLPAAAPSLSLAVRADGFFPGRSRTIHIEPGRDAYVRNVTLEPVATVSGAVTLSDTGQPATGAKLVYWSQRTQDHTDVGAVVDAAGRFEVVRDLAGRRLALLRLPGYLDQKVDLGQAEASHSITLHPRRRITGRVVYPDGTPLTGVTVSVDEPNHVPPGRRTRPYRKSVGTDADGAFVLDELWDASWTLAVSERAGNDQSFLARLVEGVAAGTTDLVVEVQRGLVIEGTVVDDAGVPAAGAALDAFTEFGDRRLVARQLTRADGSFRARASSGSS